MAVLNQTLVRWHAFCLPRLCFCRSNLPVVTRVVRPVLAVKSFNVSSDGSSVHVTLQDVTETLRVAVGRLVAGRGNCCFECIRVVCGDVRFTVYKVAVVLMGHSEESNTWPVILCESKELFKPRINVMMEEENLGKSLSKLFINCLKTLQRVATRRAPLCSVAYL